MFEDIRKYPLNLSDIKMMTCGHLNQFNHYNCIHEIKRCLLLGRKVMTNLAYSKAETLLCQQRSI